VLQVGVYNSLTDQEMHSAGVCRITLYVPYWLNNRTGIDLFYRDKTSAPTQPLMLGHPFPWDYGEVFTPGTSMTEAFDIKGGSEDASVMGWGVSGGSNGSLQNGAGGDGCMDQAVLEYKLVLMNKQEELALGLAHVRKRRYSQPLNIKTVGECRWPHTASPY